MLAKFISVIGRESLPKVRAVKTAERLAHSGNLD